MERTDFSPLAPGQVVTIPEGVAFLPDGPPGTVDVTIEMLVALDRARGALGEFVGRSRLVPNELLITTPLLTIEAVESNRIEGTHTLVADVLRQHAAGPAADQAQADRNREVLLYREALALGDDWITAGNPLNQAFIRALHAELLRDGRGSSAHPGAYRTLQVAIGARTPAAARYVPPPPDQVGPLMGDLERFMVTDPALPALIACAILHYQFEAIHPFEDGNGRIGRLLVPLYLTAKGTLPRPILYLSAYLEAHSDRYYDLLRRVSTEGQWAEWIVFFLEAVRVQSEDSHRRIERILALREEYMARVRERTRSQAALVAVDLLVSQIFITIPQIQRYARCQYNTAKSAVASLEDIGVLTRIHGTHPTTWGAPDLIREIYGER